VVHVQPFVLPATSTLPNSFGISLYSLAKGHGVNAESSGGKTLLRSYLRELLAHRLSAHGMSMTPPPVRFSNGKAEVDFQAFDEDVGPFLQGKALPNGARFSSLDFREQKAARTPAEEKAYAEAFRKHLTQLGWNGQLFFYAKDEPKEADYPLVLSQSARMRAAKIPVLITSPDDARLTPAADFLSPTLNCFFERRGPQTCKTVRSVEALRKKGPAKVWWYQSCNSHGCTSGPSDKPDIEEVYSGWASYMVDHPAPLNRAMGALAFLTGIDGELYFDTVYAYNTQDPWSGLFEFGGNGDGTLFYPGTPARLGTKAHFPVGSLRLKHIRDGLEDFEYLSLLRKLGAGKEAETMARRVVKSGHEISRNPEDWTRARASWTRALNEQWKRRNMEKGGPSGTSAGR